jgi:hypothetical protein
MISLQPQSHRRSPSKAKIIPNKKGISLASESSRGLPGISRKDINIHALSGKFKAEEQDPRSIKLILKKREIPIEGEQGAWKDC